MSTDTDTIGSQFNQNPFNQWPLQPPSPAVSYDKVFLDEKKSLIHRCAVEYDANAAAITTGNHAGADYSWKQVVGLEEVKCRIVWKGSAPTEGEARPGVMTVGRVLFGQSIVADRRNRIVYMDPDRLTLAYAYLVGAVRNAHMQNHHWVVDIQSSPLD